MTDRVTPPMSISRGAVLRRLAEARVVPVATFDDGMQAKRAGRALRQGGIGCVEITFRNQAAADAIASASMIDGLLVGAGTLRHPDQVAAAVDAGAAFGLAPGFDETVLDTAEQLGLPFFPGVATPSEIDRAHARGLDVVKVFPAATLGGPGFLRAIAAPYPDVRFIPTGGITAHTVSEYLAVPSVLAVGGSWLVDPELLRAGQFHAVTRRAAAVREIPA
jgi:2-dehydro-3-deoxyphosphogluconate aldolase / (4S)-4-hydroxy-2-oxoglutarate aldolase